MSFASWFRDKYHEVLLNKTVCFTYETANIHIIWMYLSARRALDLESIPEWSFGGVIGPQLAHTVWRTSVDINKMEAVLTPSDLQ
jgi:hypothetical protein